MIIENRLLLDLLPQKNPFVFIDALDFYTPTKSVTSFRVPEVSPMVEDGKVLDGLLVENMAQTAAIHQSYFNLQSNQAPSIGFIAEIKNLKVNKRPMIHDVLHTEIEITHQVFNCNILDGVCKLNDEIIASCTLKVMTIDERTI